MKDVPNTSGQESFVTPEPVILMKYYERTHDDFPKD